MNILKDALIHIEYTALPSGGATVHKTVLGTNINIAAAMVVTFEQYPDLLIVMESACRVYRQQLSKSKQ